MLKTITPHYYQAEIPPIVFDYVRNNRKDHPLVAMPTASGKTIVIADIVDQILTNWNSTRITILSHVKEILQQDYDILNEQLDVDLGLNSSGLGVRDYTRQVTVAGIQSVYKHADLFSDTNLVIVDEAHLIPPYGTGMYQTFFESVPNATILGLTATPFRLGSGYIYGSEDDKLFDSLVYDLTDMEAFNRLVKEGYLCKLITKETKLKMDTSEQPIRGGDFVEKELSIAFDRDAITDKAIEEIIHFGKGYQKWLIFAIDIEHAEHIAEKLIRSGVPTGVIHSKMDMNRDRILELYRNGRLKCIVNVNVLTTGFNLPSIDLIALLRPTFSPVIHVQTVGRGLRTTVDKDHCLILDFAGNTARLGPINDIHIKTKLRKGDGEGEAITKTCPECKSIHHPSIKICTVCGFEFKFKTNLTTSAGTHDIIKEGGKKWYSVDSIFYDIHKKANAPTSLVVRYHCGFKIFKEFICIEHKGYAGHMARHWAKFRYPEITDIALKTAEELLAVSENLNQPTKIKVDDSKKYPVIIDYIFNSV